MRTHSEPAPCHEEVEEEFWTSKVFSYGKGPREPEGAKLN